MRVLARKTLLSCLAGLSICVLASGVAHASPTLQFSSSAGAVGAQIGFNGDSTFDFTAATDGSDFTINSDPGGDGSALGLKGTISGVYTIGAISANSAPVTGSGVLTISDGIKNFTANVSWVSILQNGTGSTLNDQGVVNLSSLAYSGTNNDLVALAAEPQGITTLNFTFIPAKTLAQMKSTATSTTFSGTIVGVPEPATASLWLCGGLVGIVLRRRGAAGKRRSA
jgi:hypothetical protein